MKRALIIGINYELDERNRLYGCVNDACNMEKKLRAMYPAAEYRILVDSANGAAESWPSRANILAGLAWLTSGLCGGGSSDRASDRVLLHYSGHGGLTIDRDMDEASGFDSCIFPISPQGQVEFIIDDELRRAISAVPAGCTVTAVFDCCHSGTCLDLRYTVCPANVGASGADAGASGAANGAASAAANSAAVVVTEDRRHAKTAAQVFCLSGCTDQQTAADTVDAAVIPSGALTNALLAALETKSTKITRLICAVREGLREVGYPQTAQMSCGRAAAFDASFL